MTIYGVALLAICTLLGGFLGDVLGKVLGVKANVGGVGIAMLLLIAARVWLTRKDELDRGVKLGVEFWALMYIPIVVAMAATQNVASAVEGGTMVLAVGAIVVVVCFGLVALLGRIAPPKEPPVTPAEGDIISGQPE